MHDAFPGQSGIDLNRAGTPLLEIVSEPEITSPAEAAAYFRQMHALVTSLEICDGNLSEGSMRCDANVSVRPVGQTTLGERTEIKNINSFRFVEKALVFEIERHIDVLEGGGEIVRETRLYDAERDETRTMRGKELSEDYRYFPDPDLLPVEVTEELVASVRETIGELPIAKRDRYIQTLGLSDYDAGRLTEDPGAARYFEAVADACDDPKLAANWVLGDVAGALNKDGLAFDESPVAADQIGTLIKRIADDTITGKIAKTVFERLWNDGSTVDEIIEADGLRQVNDAGELQSLVDGVVADNPGQVEQYRAGKHKVLGFFVGQIMKATGGKANPKQINDMLKAALDE